MHALDELRLKHWVSTRNRQHLQRTGVEMALKRPYGVLIDVFLAPVGVDDKFKEVSRYTMTRARDEQVHTVRTSEFGRNDRGSPSLPRPNRDDVTGSQLRLRVQRIAFWRDSD